MTTIRDILFGDLLPGRVGAWSLAAEQAAEQLAASGAIPSPYGSQASQAVIARINVLLDRQINGVIVGGFQLGFKLMNAARQTASAPGTYRTVDLKAYTIPWDHEMDVDVLLDRKNLSSITFVAGLEITITALAAIVSNGRITAIAGGDGVVRAQLIAKTTKPVRLNVPLAHAHRAFDLRVELSIPNDGIPLLASRN
jgi:hypothetical protein